MPEINIIKQQFRFSLREDTSISIYLHIYVYQQKDIFSDYHRKATMEGYERQFERHVCRSILSNTYLRKSLGRHGVWEKESLLRNTSWAMSRIDGGCHSPNWGNMIPKLMHPTVLEQLTT